MALTFLNKKQYDSRSRILDHSPHYKDSVVAKPPGEPAALSTRTLPPPQSNTDVEGLLIELNVLILKLRNRLETNGVSAL